MSHDRDKLQVCQQLSPQLQRSATMKAFGEAQKGHFAGPHTQLETVHT
jgi:hypothetical protein